MTNQAQELARRLAQDAEAVCRHYLSKGKREGRYWRVGDVRNAPGRSMYVRLAGATSGKGAAGRWTDSATGEFGDLLDVIREACGLLDFADVAEEARRFLSLPPQTRQSTGQIPSSSKAAPSLSTQSSESARRLFAASGPISGTVAEAYLRGRGIIQLRDTENLRFHPNCYYRTDNDDDADGRSEAWPAMIAAVTDLKGAITGVHRTYLTTSASNESIAEKAPVDTPRRALGHLLGHGVRFGAVDDVMAAGEGIETMLSLRCALYDLPMVAALSASHLSAIQFLPTLRRIYVARDNDAAGDNAWATLAERAQDAGIEAVALTPTLRDFNDDLRQLGAMDFRAALRLQLVPEDVARFMLNAESSV